MAYRFDPHLEFLGNVSSEDLNGLVRTLTHDLSGDGTVRFTEELTYHDLYKRYYPDHNRYWHLIAAELQCFGANSFATIFRGGEGVLYREVLTDVCDKLDVNYNSSHSVDKIEDVLLLKLIDDVFRSLSQNDLREIAKELGNIDSNFLSAKDVFGYFRTAFNAGGFKSYQLSVIIVNMVMKSLLGHGLSLAGNAFLTKSLSVIAGPVGMAISAVWTGVNLSSSAYRVTIPSVMYVAVLRKKYDSLSSQDIVDSAVLTRVIKVLVEQLGIYPSEIRLDSRIVKDLGADSLDSVEILMALEEEFNCEIPDILAESVSTVRDIVKVIELL